MHPNRKIFIAWTIFALSINSDAYAQRVGSTFSGSCEKSINNVASIECLGEVIIVHFPDGYYSYQFSEKGYENMFQFVGKKVQRTDEPNFLAIKIESINLVTKSNPQVKIARYSDMECYLGFRPDRTNNNEFHDEDIQNIICKYKDKKDLVLFSLHNAIFRKKEKLTQQ